MRRVSFRVNAQLFRALDNISRKSDLSRSEVIRMCLRRSLFGGEIGSEILEHSLMNRLKRLKGEGDSLFKIRKSMLRDGSYLAERYGNKENPKEFEAILAIDQRREGIASEMTAVALQLSKLWEKRGGLKKFRIEGED